MSDAEDREMLRFRLRQSTERDRRTVYAYYLSHREAFVALRSIVAIDQAVFERRFFLIERTQSSEVVALAGVFDHQGGAYRQVGGTIVADSCRGFGMQKLLLHVRVLHEGVVRPGSKAVYTAIQPENTKAIANARAAGFSDWTPPAELEYEATAASGKKFTWLQFPDQKLREVANQFARIENNCVQLVRRAGQRAEVEVSVEAIQYFRPLMEQLASGNL